jgi:hypothetical protein
MSKTDLEEAKKQLTNTRALYDKCQELFDKPFGDWPPADKRRYGSEEEEAIKSLGRRLEQLQEEKLKLQDKELILMRAASVPQPQPEDPQGTIYILVIASTSLVGS